MKDALRSELKNRTTVVPLHSSPLQVRQCFHDIRRIAWVPGLKASAREAQRWGVQSSLPQRNTGEGGSLHLANRSTSEPCFVRLQKTVIRFAGVVETWSNWRTEFEPLTWLIKPLRFQDFDALCFAHTVWPQVTFLFHLLITYEGDTNAVDTASDCQQYLDLLTQWMAASFNKIPIDMYVAVNCN